MYLILSQYPIHVLFEWWLSGGEFMLSGGYFQLVLTSVGRMLHVSVRIGIPGDTLLDVAHRYGHHEMSNF